VVDLATAVDALVDVLTGVLVFVDGDAEAVLLVVVELFVLLVLTAALAPELVELSGEADCPDFEIVAAVGL
jgi:hypothetical protein